MRYKTIMNKLYMLGVYDAPNEKIYKNGGYVNFNEKIQEKNNWNKDKSELERTYLDKDSTISLKAIDFKKIKDIMTKDYKTKEKIEEHCKNNCNFIIKDNEIWIHDFLNISGCVKNNIHDDIWILHKATGTFVDVDIINPITLETSKEEIRIQNLNIKDYAKIINLDSKLYKTLVEAKMSESKLMALTNSSSLKDLDEGNPNAKRWNCLGYELNCENKDFKLEHIENAKKKVKCVRVNGKVDISNLIGTHIILSGDKLNELKLNPITNDVECEVKELNIDINTSKVNYTIRNITIKQKSIKAREIFLENCVIDQDIEMEAQKVHLHNVKIEEGAKVDIRYKIGVYFNSVQGEINKIETFGSSNKFTTKYIEIERDDEYKKGNVIYIHELKDVDKFYVKLDGKYNEELTIDKLLFDDKKEERYKYGLLYLGRIKANIKECNYIKKLDIDLCEGSINCKKMLCDKIKIRKKENDLLFKVLEDGKQLEMNDKRLKISKARD